MAHLAAYLCVISQHFRRGTCRAALAGWRRGCLVLVRFAASTIFLDTFIHGIFSVVRFFYLALFGNNSTQSWRGFLAVEVVCFVEFGSGDKV